MNHGEQPARTVLEQEIRRRRLTFEEFAETFAREHGEPGTLSARHVQRLAAGQRADGRPLGPVRPATRRLLEAIFGQDADVLVAPPASAGTDPAELNEWRDSAETLRAELAAARRVDGEAIALLARQVDLTRQLDRRLGAVTLLDSLRQHARTVQRLARHTTSDRTRRKLAVVLADASTLAGWQSLDRCELSAAWQHYETATAAARDARSPALEAHALAEQAVALLDIDQPRAAAELTGRARALGERHGSPLLQAWLAAAHGESLAAADDATGSLRMFDDAARLLPNGETGHDGPYLALDPVHLARWRGHALVRFGHPDAVPVLAAALARHDGVFARAETTLRIDLGLAHHSAGGADAARRHYARAWSLATAIGSRRQLCRLHGIADAGNPDAT